MTTSYEPLKYAPTYAAEYADCLDAAVWVRSEAAEAGLEAAQRLVLGDLPYASIVALQAVRLTVARMAGPEPASLRAMVTAANGLRRATCASLGASGLLADMDINRFSATMQASEEPRRDYRKHFMPLKHAAATTPESTKLQWNSNSHEAVVLLGGYRLWHNTAIARNRFRLKHAC